MRRRSKRSASGNSSREARTGSPSLSRQPSRSISARFFIELRAVRRSRGTECFAAALSRNLRGIGPVLSVLTKAKAPRVTWSLRRSERPKSLKSGSIRLPVNYQGGHKLSVIVECAHRFYPRCPSCRHITCHDCNEGQHESGAKDGQRIERRNAEKLGGNDALEGKDGRKPQHHTDPNQNQNFAQHQPRE